MLSIIIPTFNELHLEFLKNAIKQYKNMSEINLIIVDGASTDGTIEYLQKEKINFIVSKNSSRLKRLQIGIKKALELNNKFIILHHPRSILSKNFLKEMNQKNLQWGGFTHRFDMSHPMLNFTSFYSNRIRADKKGIYYLDHCIYLKRELAKDLLTIADREIFEDTEISKILLTHSTPKRLSAISTTSSIRFMINGIFRQSLLNQKLKLLYLLKTNDKEMNKNYERKLNLNNQVDD